MFLTGTSIEAVLSAEQRSILTLSGGLSVDANVSLR